MDGASDDVPLVRRALSLSVLGQTQDEVLRRGTSGVKQDPHVCVSQARKETKMQGSNTVLSNRATQMQATQHLHTHREPGLT